MNPKQVAQAILKLNKETASGSLIWDVCRRSPTIMNAKDVLAGPAFEVSIAERSFRLFKIQRRMSGYEEEWEWQDGFILEVFTTSTGVPWVIENHSALADLYTTVQFQASNAQEFLDDFLKE